MSISCRHGQSCCLWKRSVWRTTFDGLEGNKNQLPVSSGRHQGKLECPRLREWRPAASPSGTSSAARGQSRFCFETGQRQASLVSRAICLLVGALSPVSHRGYHQGCSGANHWNHFKTGFTGPLHWFLSAADRIARLRQTVDQGLKTEVASTERGQHHAVHGQPCPRAWTALSICGTFWAVWCANTVFDPKTNCSWLLCCIRPGTRPR